MIFTHQPRDAHQDHRLLSELTWNTFRNHFILEYEIPKYDGDMGRPSVFVPLDREDVPGQSESPDGFFRFAAHQALVRRTNISRHHAPPRHGVQCSQRLRRIVLLSQTYALKFRHVL